MDLPSEMLKELYDSLDNEKEQDFEEMKGEDMSDYQTVYDAVEDIENAAYDRGYEDGKKAQIDISRSEQEFGEVTSKDAAIEFLDKIGWLDKYRKEIEREAEIKIAKLKADSRELQKSERLTGQAEAWVAAKKIVCKVEDGGLNGNVLSNIFGDIDYDDYQSLLTKVSADEAIKRIKEYENRKEETYNVGDEVYLNPNVYPVDNIALILNKDRSDNPYHVLLANGCSLWIKECFITGKTGRHTDKYKELMEWIGGENE